MPTATIDGLEVNYVTQGSGPALLMLAPGGFDATMEKWTTAGVWKGMRPLETLSGAFRVIAYDFWSVMPPEQTPDNGRERILEFGRAHAK